MLGGLDYRPPGNAPLLASKIQVVESVTALKALQTPNSKQVVIVLGFAAAGDGGGGLYWWNSSDTTADNGGTIIQLNIGGGGRFNRLF